MWNDIAKIVGVLTLICLVAVASLGAEAGSATPPELAKLEREISLKIAHARGIGITDSDRLKKLIAAERLDLKAEHLISSGAYKSAEDNLLRAKVLLRELGI